MAAAPCTHVRTAATPPPPPPHPPARSCVGSCMARTAAWRGCGGGVGRTAARPPPPPVLLALGSGRAVCRSGGVWRCAPARAARRCGRDGLLMKGRVSGSLLQLWQVRPGARLFCSPLFVGFQKLLLIAAQIQTGRDKRMGPVAVECTSRPPFPSSSPSGTPCHAAAAPLNARRESCGGRGALRGSGSTCWWCPRGRAVPCPVREGEGLTQQRAPRRPVCRDANGGCGDKGSTCTVTQGLSAAQLSHHSRSVRTQTCHGPSDHLPHGARPHSSLLQPPPRSQRVVASARLTAAFGGAATRGAAAITCPPSLSAATVWSPPLQLSSGASLSSFHTEAHQVLACPRSSGCRRSRPIDGQPP